MSTMIPTPVPAIPQVIDTIDSFYQFVKNQVLVINPSREFGGIVQARDWPMQELKLNTPYLLIQRIPPTRSPHQSFFQLLMTFSLQWAWAVQGDNVPGNAQAANRGDKYRINMQIINEMILSHNPGYCFKSQYIPIPNSDGSNIPVLVGTAYNPVDALWWNPPGFVDKIDRTTGILFCAGPVDVYSYAPAVASS